MRALFAIVCSATLALLLGEAAPGLLAQTNAPPALHPNLPLAALSSNLFQLGTVRLDKENKTVSFSARLNRGQGPLEYILVTKKGKLHESLLQTEIEPSDLQVALLLLGARGAPPSVELQKMPYEPYRINRSGDTNNLFPRLVLSGDQTAIDLSWNTPAGLRRLPVEDCVLNLQSNAPVCRGPWIYNGSRVVNGVFMAQREGSIVALVDDVEALFNNPRPGHDNDQIWTANPTNLPPTNATVQISIKLK